MYRAFPCADYYHRSATRPFLQSQLTHSSRPSICRGKTNDRASDVHIAIRIAVDRRLLLDARKAQTQCPRRWLMACTPLARAVKPHRKPFHRLREQRLPNVSHHLRRLQCVQGEDASNEGFLRRPSQPRLEALCRSGVPAGCPVFSGLQTGSCSGPPPAGSALVLWGKHYLNPWVPFFEVEYYRYALRRAPVPP
jgi:hypothetical protein